LSSSLGDASATPFSVIVPLLIASPGARHAFDDGTPQLVVAEMIKLGRRASLTALR